MMKLKNLFDNVPVSLMLLKNWDFNDDTINAIKPFRTSANAVYRFNDDNDTFYLRFAPLDEKKPELVQAELDFLEYLRENKYAATEAVESKDGSKVIAQNTPWGMYLAVVFKSVIGKPMEQTEFSPPLYYKFGRTLGNLHRLSSEYKPKNIRRPDWEEELSYIKEMLTEYSAPTNALCEVEVLHKFFTKLNANKDNYGLVHFDFDFDNVFYNEDNEIHSVIDFDNAMYHWYVMDIEQTINSIKNNLPETFQNQAIEQFFLGYRSEKDIDTKVLSFQFIFRRYAHLYGYVRWLRSIHESWNNEPEWVTGLRAKLKSGMEKIERDFGKEIDL